MSNLYSLAWQRYHRCRSLEDRVDALLGVEEHAFTAADEVQAWCTISAEWNRIRCRWPRRAPAVIEAARAW